MTALPTHQTFSRFALVGMFITGLHVTVATLALQRLEMASVPANCLAFVIANLTSFVLHTRWSFATTISLARYRRFFAVSVFGLLLTAAISYTTSQLGLPDWAGIAAVVTLVPLNNFLLHHLWTYSG